MERAGNMKLLVTGGAGFIGSHFIHYWLKHHPEDQIVNLDALTYAGHLETLKDVENDPRYKFIKGDIADEEIVRQAMVGIAIVVHFAAESHVDRSIVGPKPFRRTNIEGTGVLLDVALEHKLERFHHISTDEVYGDLGPDDPPFTPDHPYRPHTPYAASKAASDLLVRSYYDTYNLPITISNCANNYGDHQDLEKYLSRSITNLILGKNILLMGEGKEIREWLHVEDHCAGIDVILENGQVGETYLLQGEERTNMAVAQALLKIFGLDASRIESMEHRIRHDFRYANDASKIMVLGWERKHNFDEELPRLVKWYKENRWWWEPLLEGRPNVDASAQKSYGQ